MSTGTANEEGEFGFQIAPMVDVVFVLLLFFMACAGQNITETFLKVGLPSPTGGATFDPPIVIDIDATGNVFMNSAPKSASPTDQDLAQLRAVLDTVAEDGESPTPVLIRPALDARHGRVVDVLNTCRQAKVKNLNFL